MDVTSTSNTATASQSAAKTGNGATKFTADLNTFLKLLTTQLKIRIRPSRSIPMNSPSSSSSSVRSSNRST